MSSQVQEPKMRRYKVTVSMVHHTFTDKFIGPPNRDRVLQIVLDKLSRGELDDWFTIQWEEV